MVFYTRKEIEIILNPEHSMFPEFEFCQELISSLWKNKDQLFEIIQALHKNIAHRRSRNRLLFLRLLLSVIHYIPQTFHRDLFTDKFCKTIEYILSKKYKTQFFNYLIGKNRDNQRQIEQILLYFVQLCYDTFMLYEDQYKGIIGVYKLLRSEGV